MMSGTPPTLATLGEAPPFQARFSTGSERGEYVIKTRTLRAAKGVLKLSKKKHGIYLWNHAK